MYITNQNNFFYPDALGAAIAHAKTVFPEESCGAIIQDEFVPFENRADDPANEFLINNLAFDLAYQDGGVQAVIHSHNSHAMASIADQQQQLALDVPFGIVNLVNNSCTQFVFWGDVLPVEPLKKRPFFYGVWDCFTLVRDYFRTRHGITIPLIPREHGWWLRGESMFEDLVDQFDADPVPVDQARPNDVLFYNLHGQKYVNHCAVLQDNGLVLHHFENHLSNEFPVSVCQQFLHKTAWRLRGVS